MERIVKLAAERAAPVAMHLAESREELELLAAGTGPFRELLEERSMWDETAIPRGTRPLDYLHMLAESPRGLVVHGNYLDADEIEFLGQRRDTISVAYCPRTHAYFGHAKYPLDRMLAAGARVVLGTDSRASNPDLNLLADLRLAAQQFPQVSPETWLRMATLDGATALGLDAAYGNLAPGNLANIIAMPCSAADDPHEIVVNGFAAPSHVWLHGRRQRAGAS
jgi:cytosine/adenosine deaminase-related metal-dependent hydrolase